MVLLQTLKLMRLRHWVKNLFLFIPLMFTPALYGYGYFPNLVIAFFCFSFISSAVYVVNDFKDQDADRLHPVKKNRPIASGAVSNSLAAVIFLLLLITAFTISYQFLDTKFLIILAAYFVINLLYCFYKKSFNF